MLFFFSKVTYILKRTRKTIAVYFATIKKLVCQEKRLYKMVSGLKSFELEMFSCNVCPDMQWIQP